jgi:hypothetical protein
MNEKKVNETIDYKGFTITNDKIYGWSLIDRYGGWCCSVTKIYKLKEIVDNIINSEQL